MGAQSIGGASSEGPPRQGRLSDAQCEQFDCEGVLHIAQLLPAESIERARQAVIRPLETLGLWRDGEWRLEGRSKPEWPSTGLKPGRDVGHRHREIEALLDEPGVLATVDLLLSHHSFDRKIHPRPQVLVSLPNARPWSLPNGWHTDAPRLASGESPGVQLFTFLEEVEPRGGGTLVVAGSHRLLNDGRNLKPREVAAALRDEPFIQELFRPEPAHREGLPVGRAGEVSLCVRELTGRPGDAWLMDLRLLHAAAPNAAKRPRMMVTHRFYRADLTSEIAEAFGWA